MQSFSNFPIELRIKIWEYALPGGRNIEICPALIGREEIAWRVVQCNCSTHCNRLPSIAHVNSEARGVFFAHFTTCFNIYIQWKHDTILVQRTSVMKGDIDLDAGFKEIQALVKWSRQAQEARNYPPLTSEQTARGFVTARLIF